MDGIGQTRSSAVLFFAPFVSSSMRVEPGWIDYNGHLNTAFYHVLFDRAVDEAFSLVGLGPDYVTEQKASFFHVEGHTLYKRELTQDQQVRVTLRLIDYDLRRLHYYMELRDAAEGWVAAVAEHLSIHVDMQTRRASPFPKDVFDNLAVMKTAHARLPRPEALGRSISLQRTAADRVAAHADPAGAAH